nr:family 43 glycosylhydrolase [uncultured Pedobacter sp.]
MISSLLFAGTSNAQSKYSAYLFAYFTGNQKADESIHFALSDDGFQYKALNHNQAILASATISETGGVRDPHILRGNDGKTFYMVATDMVSAKGWSSNRGMVLLKSKDLINWTSSIVNFQKRFKGNDDLLRVWAPQTIYDAKAGKYMVYFSLKNGNSADIIYYSYANKDFTDLETEPKQLLYSPDGGSCIDGDIIEKDNKFYLFFKTEGNKAGIKVAVSDHLTSGYVVNDQYLQQTNDAVEGAGVFKLINSDNYILMYDVYIKGRYQFTESNDLNKFRVVDDKVKMDFHPRHGTVISITKDEKARLLGKWGDAQLLLTHPQSKLVKTINIVTDSAKHKITLPLKQDAKLGAFNPKFIKAKGLSYQPKGKANFLNGAVNYVVKRDGQKEATFKVEAKIYGNPVLPGLYADPDIIYSNKRHKYYIYPTSDGFDNWSGYYFKTFSSKDLTNWKDEGIILNLKTDLTWANRNAWAPCIIERKINGKYKYFYYFTAAQKIGVAVADDPAGPFKDSGKPLIEKNPQGHGGQVIDPDVFQDPKTGKYYLYWGNGYLAGAELNDDMVSIKEETLKILTPDKTFREGTHVLFRNGIYYFMWSENDTRDEDYRVGYGMADGPLSPIKVPNHNIVVQKSAENGIFATGHNSTIQVPGKDEWYLVYHRFNYPKGITQGQAAGYNREVCIDKLLFNPDGTIAEVKPTHEGVKLQNR